MNCWTLFNLLYFTLRTCNATDKLLLKVKVTPRVLMVCICCIQDGAHSWFYIFYLYDLWDCICSVTLLSQFHAPDLILIYYLLQCHYK